MTKSSENNVAQIEQEGIEFETAAILASASPLGITTMGAFPLSLIASGQIRRRHFDNSLTLQPKRTMNATEELETAQQTEMTALARRIEATKPGARRCPPPAIRHGDGWLAVFVILIALAALLILGLPLS
jgi:hypothetical protein